MNEHQSLNKEEMESSIPIRVDIKSVDFLVPVNIKFEIINTITDEIVGEEFSIDGSIDVAKQKLSLNTKFPDQVMEQIKISVFKHIFNVSVLEEDQFEANEDVYAQADRAQKEHDDLHDQNLGEIE